MNDDGFHFGALPKLPDWMQRKTGFVCENPVHYNFQSEMFTRACGRCLRCQARDKRDLSGRAAAEAAVAADVVCFTLTYGRGHEGAQNFVTADRQNFLKRLRAWLHDEARRAVGAPKRMPKRNAHHVRAFWKHKIAAVLPKIRYLGCGERGKQNTKRCHWHVVIFGSRPLGLTATPRDDKGELVRQKHPLWQLGFCTVDVLPVHGVETRMKAVRYCIKYLTKSKAVTIRQRRAGVPEEAKFFYSTATPLGFEYLTDHARRVAQAGLPLTGKYRVPGVTNSRRGWRPETSGYTPAPRASEFQPRGRMRDHYIAAYRAEWETIHGEKPIPATEWIVRHDPDWAFPWATVCDSGRVVPIGSGSAAAAVQTAAARPGLLVVHDRNGAALGVVKVASSGAAYYRPVVGFDEPVRNGGLRDVAGFSEAQHVAIEQWIADARGPGWRDPRELRREHGDRLRRQKAALLPVANDSPNLNADYPHLPPLQAVTALRRKLMLFGDGYMPGRAVRDVRDGIGAPLTISVGARLRKSASMRPA